MGEVYRARDARLDRDVAIKILPEAFAADAERVARFQREAKVLASLNHPNIAIIHGLEQAAGAHPLVMELVEGEDLAQRNARGAVPIDEALPIVKQIAECERGVLRNAESVWESASWLKECWWPSRFSSRDVTSFDERAAWTSSRL
jgi:serine/threonine protein kinase